MRLREIPHGLALAAPTEGYIRSPGLHASDLYGSFYKKHDPKRYDKRDGNGDPTPFDLPKMELGTSFEEVLEPALAARLLGERPGEFHSPHESDCPHGSAPVIPGTPCAWCGAGTVFTPDYLFDINDELVLGEFKCSWYSTKNAPVDEKFAKWWTQIKLYLHWLQLRRVRLYVFFVNGDYKPPTPVLRAWEAVFTTQELQDEFNVIARHCRKERIWNK